MGREHGQALVLQGDEAHQHVAVSAFAADLLGVDARGLVAVVAVGDQQLGAAQRLLEGGDRAGVADAAQPIDRAVVVGQLGDGGGRGAALGPRRPPGSS